MKYCPVCDELIPLDAVYCQYCGVNTQNPEEGQGEKESDADGAGSPSRPDSTAYTPAPFGIVMVNLLLLLATFWGLSLAITILPVFIDPAYTNLIPAVGIGTQVVLRIGIAFLAISGRYHQKIGTLEGKIATFILAFIPLGALYSFLYAARGLSNRRYLPTLTSSALGASALSAVLMVATYAPLTGYAAQIDTAAPIPLPDSEPVPQNTPLPNTTATPTDIPTVIVSNPQITHENSPSDRCNSPSIVTMGDSGKNIEVCGRVTNYGELDCPDCPSGNVSYILLDKSFKIISYDWEFTFAWLGDCIKVSDTVEVFGAEPVFNFSRGEGYSGSECYTDSQGELVCEDGGYFQSYTGCEEITD